MTVAEFDDADHGHLCREDYARIRAALEHRERLVEAVRRASDMVHRGA